MGANVKMFWVLSSFYYAASIGYTSWALVDPFHKQVEWVGTLAMAMCGIMFSLIAFYLGRVHRAQGGELVEDRPDSTVDEGAELGFFSPWSWWPITISFGIGLVFLGLAVGPWICFIGFALALISLVGWIFEYYRGIFAR